MPQSKLENELPICNFKWIILIIPLMLRVESTFNYNGANGVNRLTYKGLVFAMIVNV